MKKFISICEVCDYIWNSLIYIGKDPSADNNELEKKLGKSGGQSWHRIFMGKAITCASITGTQMRSCSTILSEMELSHVVLQD